MAAEVALIALLIRVRAFASLPAFFIYICWNLLSDSTLFFARNSIPAITDFRVFEVQMVIDSAMIFAVLVELAWSVLRPVRSSLPKGSWIAIVVVVALAGLLIWPIAGFAIPDYQSALGRNFFRLQQTFAILRVIIFLAIAGFSQMLSIGWRNRELQVASGLGLYSMVSLAVTIVHTHQLVTSAPYHWLDFLSSASYVAALGYWVYSFATKEAVRQEFSPQMQQLFLAVAGAARADRVSITDSTSTRPRKRDDR
jgi:hypothetical protein